MKIAYVTTYGSSDIHAWSGLGNHILNALRECGAQTELIENLPRPFPWFFAAKWLFYRKMLDKTYQVDREPVILRHYAARVAATLAHSSCDVVFSPGTIPIAYLQTSRPIVFWTDATFAGMIDYYPEFSNLCAETIRDGHAMEQRALSSCRLAIYASEWAANSAIVHYAVDPAKVKVVPFGANIACRRDSRVIESIVAAKRRDVCKLLFVGVDWLRKGGDLAVDVARVLNERGLTTELHAVGSSPTVPVPRFVKLHGFISKSTAEGRAALDRLMTDAHFLIVPSRCECFGVVFAEASSFGLPSLATRTGGIPSAVRDGRNGQTFPLDASPEQYSDYIEHVMSSPPEYRQLALASFREYTERLNWSAAGTQVSSLLREFCN